MDKFFFNPEFIELSQKNIDFTMNVLKTTADASTENLKKAVNVYFNYLNENIDYMAKNYRETIGTGSDMTALYKENILKINEMTKKILETPVKK